MTVHASAAILKAYADNTDLVVFMLGSNSKWNRTSPKALMDYPDDEFFACLPQHEKPCLHWLNGGDIELQSAPDWFVYSADYDESYVWGLAIVFMDKTYYLREKPRKEKRWIICSPSHGDVNEILFQEKPDMRNYGEYCQLIEIEIEV